MTSRNVTIIGSYNVGLFLKGQRMPGLGETIIADTFHEGGGGKGSNQAVACAVFRANTRFIGRLGADKYGIDALAMYRQFGINTEMIKMDASIHTGISIILIDSAGNNLISVVPGANLKFTKEDVDAAKAILKDSFVVGFQFENDHEIVFYGIKKVHNMGVTTYLDPAPATKLPDDLYPHINIIKPNETEATILTGIEVNSVETAEKAGQWLLEKGVGTAIVTLGQGGSVLVTNERVQHFPAQKVDAVDTTGAGDIYSGGFLSSLAKGKNIDEAIQFATAAATLSTTKLGVIESIPTLEEAEAFLKA